MENEMVAECFEAWPCFARAANGMCLVLNRIYQDRDCPFRKEHAWDPPTPEQLETVNRMLAGRPQGERMSEI